MKLIKILVMTVVLLAVAVSGELLAQTLSKPFAVDYDIYNFNITMDSFVLKPQNIDTKLQINISYLPENKDLKNLPVIYVTDGQWRRMDHKYIHYLTDKKMIPPVIVAGIGYPEEYDANLVRINDLMDHPDTFLKVIREEVIPFVESKYSIDPRKRYLFGASAGGHFAVYSLIKNSFDLDPTFCGYIGSSPFLPGSNVNQLAGELASIKREINANLYLAYGEKEVTNDYYLPGNTLFETLENQNLNNLSFWRHIYPESDHFSNTRLTLIDGLRLFLGNEESKGIGAVDLNYKSYRYDFKTTTQFYDWNTNIFAANSFNTNPKYSLDQSSGSFKVAADFTKYNSLKFETSSVYFEGLADQMLEFNIYIPKDLAKLKYSLRFLIYSTQPNNLQWVTDYSENFKIGKSGWNTFKYKWRGNEQFGNVDCIRGFGVMITKNHSVWKGDLYFDNIKW